jgi:hypothetical protein
MAIHGSQPSMWRQQRTMMIVNIFNYIYMGEEHNRLSDQSKQSQQFLKAITKHKKLCSSRANKTIKNTVLAITILP